MKTVPAFIVASADMGYTKALPTRELADAFALLQNHEFQRMALRTPFVVIGPVELPVIEAALSAVA